MKKIYFTFIMGVFSLHSFAQVEKLPIDSLTKKVKYEGIVEIVNTPKNELYIRTKNWLSDNFKDAKKVIETDDKEAGLIIGKGTDSFLWHQVVILQKRKKNDTVSTLVDGEISFTVKIYLKDNKAKYIITDINDDTRWGGALDNIYVYMGKKKTLMSNSDFSIYTHHFDVANEVNSFCSNLIYTLNNALKIASKKESDF
jgi:hypothetical protein